MKYRKRMVESIPDAIDFLNKRDDIVWDFLRFQEIKPTEMSLSYDDDFLRLRYFDKESDPRVSMRTLVGLRKEIKYYGKCPISFYFWKHRAHFKYLAFHQKDNSRAFAASDWKQLYEASEDSGNSHFNALNWLEPDYFIKNLNKPWKKNYFVEEGTFHRKYGFSIDNLMRDPASYFSESNINL